MKTQSMLTQEQLASNLAHVRSAIEEAAQKAGRTAEEITLVAVSKTVPVELVRMAYNLGVVNFGENRVQDALPKIAEVHPQEVRWHMIGHLQSNKANKVVGPFYCVQSVDSLHLAQTLNRHAAEHGIRLPILLQVNVSGEASKEGMSPVETPEVALQIPGLPLFSGNGFNNNLPL